MLSNEKAAEVCDARQLTVNLTNTELGMLYVYEIHRMNVSDLY